MCGRGLCFSGFAAYFVLFLMVVRYTNTSVRRSLYSLLAPCYLRQKKNKFMLSRSSCSWVVWNWLRSGSRPCYKQINWMQSLCFLVGWLETECEILRAGGFETCSEHFECLVCPWCPFITDTSVWSLYTLVTTQTTLPSHSLFFCIITFFETFKYPECRPRSSNTAQSCQSLL